LTVWGANDDKLYIFFSVNGVLVQNWGVPQPYYADVMDTTVNYNSPITLKSTVNKITVNITTGVTVKEGEPFSQPPMVTVTDINGTPVAGQMVFATVVSGATYNSSALKFPYGYPPYIKNVPLKKLLFPIPGIYTSDYENPMALNDALYPLLTDANG
jgi:hypothetical protein